MAGKRCGDEKGRHRVPKQPATEETSMVRTAVMVSAPASCGPMPGMDEISPSCSHREGNHTAFMHSGVASWVGARALVIGVQKRGARRTLKKSDSSPQNVPHPNGDGRSRLAIVVSGCGAESDFVAPAFLFRN